MPKFSSGIKLGTVFSASQIGFDLFSSTFWEVREVHSLTLFLKIFYQYLWFKWKEFGHSESISWGCLGCLLAWPVLLLICLTGWLLSDHSILIGRQCIPGSDPGDSVHLGTQVANEMQKRRPGKTVYCPENIYMYKRTVKLFILVLGVRRKRVRRKAFGG